MAIEFECPECEATIRVKESAAGKTGRCPKCRVLLLVPDPDEWENDEEDDVTDQRKEAADSKAEPPSGAEPVPSRSPESTAPRIEPRIDPLPTEEGPETQITSTSMPRPNEEDTVRPGPSPPELHADNPPTVPSEAPLDFSDSDPRLAAVTRVRSRRRHRRRRAPAKTLVTTSIAGGGILLILGVGWWLYAGSGPDLSGSIEGQRPRRVSFAEVSAPLPSDDVPQETIDRVLDDLASQSFSIDSAYVLVEIHDGGEALDIAIAPGPRADPVRVKLAAAPHVKTALAEVEEKIVRAKQNERRGATAAFLEDYAAYIKEGKTIENLLEYRDRLALNAAVDSVGFAVEAVVQSTPFPCVYQDAAGYCYFFVPEGTNQFRIRGRKVLGKNQDAPLPVDFQVTVADLDQSASAGQSSVENPPADNQDDSDTDSDPRQSGEKKEENDAQNTNDEDAENGDPPSEEKPSNDDSNGDA